MNLNPRADSQPRLNQPLDPGLARKPLKILFIFTREKPYSSASVRELPSGGTEKAVVYLGEALALLGHEVSWITTQAELVAAEGVAPDVVITQEAELLQLFPGTRKVWWTHHFSDQPVIQRGAAYGRVFADKVVTLSQCHQDDFKTNLRIDSVRIGHGIWPAEVVKADKDPFRLIYASTPFRGLEKIPALFRAIKAAEPRATIAICSSMGTYGQPEQDAEYSELFAELAAIPGVELHGALNQAQLFAEYARASIYFYPCTWPETYCLALDEALAHGCTPVVTATGALPERVDDGYCFMGADANFVYGPLHFWQSGPTNSRTGKQPRDWLQVAKQWEAEVLYA